VAASDENMSEHHSRPEERPDDPTVNTAEEPSSIRRGEDTLELHGLRARGFHGVLPEERAAGQVFVVDAALTLDTRPAAATDDLAATVDYAALARDLVAVVEGEPVDLIETLADRLAAVCLADERVNAVAVTVHKPEAPIDAVFDDVRITVHRRR
jgi:7,8-dihydroneopterin aldolase/epimerase/oxygenase